MLTRGVFMRCIGCDSDDTVVVLMEIFPCKYCSGEIKIEYNVCKNCGVGWKTVDDEILSGTTFFDVGLDAIFDGDEDEVVFDMAPIIDHNKDKSHMADYVYKCLRCQAICYEKEEDLYECPECGFQWEIVRSR